MATIINNSKQEALTTLARLKSFLGLSTDRFDTQLVIAINQATGFIERYCKRSFKSQTYTDEEYDGPGSPTLLLKQYPVTTFSQLQVNDANDNTDSWSTIGTDRYFFYEDGRISFATNKGTFLDSDSGLFLAGRNKYRATYIAGYLIDFSNENDPDLHTLPQELEYACMKLVSGIFNSARAEGLEQTRIGDSWIRMKPLLFNDKELKEILDKYAKATI